MSFSLRRAGTIVAASCAAAFLTSGSQPSAASTHAGPPIPRTPVHFKRTYKSPQSCTSTRLFVPEYNGGDVQVYCTANDEALTPITGLTTPAGTAADEGSNQLFVSEPTPDDIKVYNLQTLVQTTTVGGYPPFGPYFLADDAMSGTIFQTSYWVSGDFRAIDVATDAGQAYLQYDLNTNSNNNTPFGIAVDPASATVFVGVYQSQVYAIQKKPPFRILKTITGLSSCGLAVQHSRSLLFVAECVTSGAGDIKIYNEKTLNQIATVQGLDQYVTGLAIDQSANRFYAAEYGSNGLGDVRIYSLTNGQELGTIGPFNTPYGISIG